LELIFLKFIIQIQCGSYTMTVLSTDNLLSVTSNHFDVTVLPILGVASAYF